MSSMSSLKLLNALVSLVDDCHKFHQIRYLPVQDLTTIRPAEEAEWCPDLVDPSLAYTKRSKGTATVSL